MALNYAQKKNIAAFFLSLFFAWGAAVLLWMWWVSFDLPVVQMRPHQAIWEIINRACEMQGEQVADGPLRIGHKVLVGIAAYTMNEWGRSFAGLTAYQLPMMFALLFGVGLLGWRFGGRTGGLLAPWVAAFAPMTVGLATQPDDLLFLQAMVTLAFVCVFWSDRPGWSWLIVAAIFPLAAAVRNTFWFSVNLLVLFIFLATSGAWWLARVKLRRDDDSGSKMTYSRMVLSAAAIVFIFLITYVASLPLDLSYVFGEMDQTKSGILQNPSIIISVPYILAHFMLGPWVFLATIAGVVVVFRYRRFWDYLPVLAWLLSLAILLTFLSKRQDFYLVATIPAAYVLVSAPVGLLPGKRMRILVSLLLVTLLASSWLVLAQRTRLDYMQQIQRGQKLFTCLPSPYLHAPWMTPFLPEERDAARWAAGACGSEHRHAVIIEGEGIDMQISYWLWLKNPSLLIGAWRHGPIYLDENPCLIVSGSFAESLPSLQAIPLDVALTENYQHAIAQYVLHDEQFEKRYADLLARVDNYRQAGAYNNWLVYLPR